jgi:hypothetical protein
MKTILKTILKLVLFLPVSVLLGLLSWNCARIAFATHQLLPGLDNDSVHGVIILLCITMSIAAGLSALTLFVSIFVTVPSQNQMNQTEL